MSVASGMALPGLLSLYLRTPATFAMDPLGNVTATFVPPLTAAEQTAFADLQLMASFAIPATITLSEFQAIKPDLATCRAFNGLASPTLAQVITNAKASNRVLGALLRS